MIKVSIVGVTGYVGLELLRLLQTHPEVEIKHLLSRSQPGEKIADLYPQFAGSALAEIKLESYEDTDLTDSDLVFTALPHGVSQREVAKIYKQGIKVIDMSGDYRYGDIDVYESWYKLKHEYPELARRRYTDWWKLTGEDKESQAGGQSRLLCNGFTAGSDTGGGKGNHQSG